MKCPLFLINSESCPYENCLEAGCAWWNEEKKQCAILTFAQKTDNEGFKRGYRKAEEDYGI